MAETKIDVDDPSDPNRAANSDKGACLKFVQAKRSKSTHVPQNKREVYEKLMDLLDGAEERQKRRNFYAVAAVELLFFSGLLAGLVCSLTVERLKHRRALDLRVWQWFAMSLMVVSGLLGVQSLTVVVLWPVKWWWRINKYVVYFTRRLKPCVDITLWFCVVLGGWYVWFRPRIEHVNGNVSVVVAHQVTRFLIALCIGSFLWLLKNVLYFKLEADLHYEQLFQRIQLTVVDLHGIQILHKRGMWKFLYDAKKKKGNNIWIEVMEMDRQTTPIWILRRLEEEYLDQLRFTPLPGNNNLTRDDQRVIRKAKKLFKQLTTKRITQLVDVVYAAQQQNLGVVPQADHHFRDREITREDLIEGYELTEPELDFIFKPRNKKEEEEEDHIHEGLEQATSNGSHGERTIGHEEFLKWAVRAYKRCWGLKRTLHSSKRVLYKLNRLLSAFIVMIVVIIWLLLSEIVNTGQLAVLFAPFVTASFVFGDSCKNMFSGLIFAFAMHPFDVGDRVVINDTQMRVKELNILTSIFYKYDTGEEVIIPNATLTTTSIINLDITPDQSDQVKFTINAQTPIEDIKDLEIKIKKLLDDDIEYSSKTKVGKSQIVKDDITMIVYFKYLVSYLTEETKALHRSKILSSIMEFLKEMKLNSKEFPSSYEPYIVEFNFSESFTLKDIKHIHDEIMSGLDEQYRPNSKPVITELTKSRIKMGLYMRRPHSTDEKEPLKEDESAQIVLLNNLVTKWKEQCKVKNKPIQVKIYESPKKGNKEEIIAQGGIGWGSFRAKDVIPPQDRPSTSSEITHYSRGA